MVAKLYERRGVTLTNATGIVKAEKPNTIATHIFGAIARETDRLSRENYSLGKAKLINDVLSTAYEQAPDNPKQFNELVQSGFDKGLQGLDDNTRKKILQSANDKVKSLQVRVGNNLNRRLDAENTERVVNLANDAVYGLGGIYDLNQRISEAIINGGSRDDVDNLIQQKNKVIAKYNNLASARNMNGRNILGKNAMFQFAKENETGMLNAVKDSILNMDIDQLRDFDERTLQNKKGFLEKTGLSEKSYSALESLVKKQGKRLDENYKRELKTQAQHNLAALYSSIDPEALAANKGLIDDRIYKEFEGMIKLAQENPVNPALMTNEDDNFIDQYSMIFDVITSKPDGRDDYNDRLLEAGVQAKKGLIEYRKNKGSTDEISQIIDTMLTDTITDQMFADTLNETFSEGTALHSLIKDNEFFYKKGKTLSEATKQNQGLIYDILEPTGLSKTRRNIINTTNSAMIRAAQERGDFVDIQVKDGVQQAQIIKKEDIIGEDIQKRKKETLKNGILAMMSMRASADFLDEEQQEEVYNQISKYGRELNKEMIRINASPIINEPTMQRLEKELAQGKKALFNIGTRVLEFLGFSDNDIIVKEEY